MTIDLKEIWAHYENGSKEMIWKKPKSKGYPDFHFDNMKIHDYSEEFPNILGEFPNILGVSEDDSKVILNDV